MFPDSKIAASFACGERKCQYLCTFGLDPYFKKLTLADVSKQSVYVMLFDESLNHYLQSKQLDMLDTLIGKYSKYSRSKCKKLQESH